MPDEEKWPELIVDDREWSSWSTIDEVECAREYLMSYSINCDILLRYNNWEFLRYREMQIIKVSL